MLERIVRCRIAAFLLVLAGCAAPPPEAVITGSKIEAPLPGSPDDLRIFVMEIDNKLTLNGPEGWNRRIVVPPGKHLITFGIAHELKVAGPFHAVTLTMDEGKVYTLRARAPVSKGDDLLCASAWIEEGEGAGHGENPDVVGLQSLWLPVDGERLGPALDDRRPQSASRMRMGLLSRMCC